MKYGLFLAITLLISGCGPSIIKEPILTNQDAKKINGTLLEVTVSKKKLQTGIHHSDAGSSVVGGMLGAIIDEAVDSSKRHQAKLLIAPLQRSFMEIDVAQQIAGSLDQEPRGVSRLKLHEVTTTDVQSRQKTMRLLKGTSNNAALFVKVKLSMMANFRGLMLETDLHLSLAEESSSRKLLVAKFYSTSDLLQETDPAKLITVWSAGDGKLLREELGKAIQKTSLLIKERLAQSEELVYEVENW